MHRFTRGLLLTALAIVLLGAADGCQQKFDEVCDFALSAVEVTRGILDVADRAVKAAEHGVDAACASFGTDCSDAQEALVQARLFFVDARSKFVKAELLVKGVCLPDGTLAGAGSFTDADRAYIRREVKDLKAWIKQHGGTP